MKAVIIGALIGVIGTLLGVIISGVINFYQNKAKFEREMKRQNQQLIRKKLEEICKGVEEIRQSYLDGETEIKQYIDHGIMRLWGPPLPLARLSMLINIYAPIFKGYLEQLDEVRKLFAELTTKVIYYKDIDKKISQESLDKLCLVRKQISKVCGAIANASVNIARQCV